MHKSELQYELRVRGKFSQMAVDELRRRVRKIFVKESSGARVYMRYIPDYLDDLKDAEAVMDTLADSDLTKTSDRRVKTIYLHVYHRLRYLTNYDGPREVDKGRALLAMRRLNEIREKLQETFPDSLRDIPRLSYAPDSTAPLTIGEPPVATDVTDFLTGDLALDDRPFPDARTDALSIASEEE